VRDASIATQLALVCSRPLPALYSRNHSQYLEPTCLRHVHRQLGFEHACPTGSSHRHSWPLMPLRAWAYSSDGGARNAANCRFLDGLLRLSGRYPGMTIPDDGARDTLHSSKFLSPSNLPLDWRRVDLSAGTHITTKRYSHAFIEEIIG